MYATDIMRKLTRYMIYRGIYSCNCQAYYIQQKKM